ncbi:hypothetical protein D9M68_696640 [compost metagenome]
MRKISFILAIIICFSLSSVAQNSHTINKMSLGLDFGFPAGDANNGVLLLGLNLQYEYPVSQSTSLTGSAGYSFQFSTGKGGSSNGNLPLKIGGKQYLNQNLYVTAETGVIFNLISYGQTTSFAFSPGLGLSLPTPTKSSIDLGLRYEKWVNPDSPLSFFALRAAYAFGL